MMRWLRGYLSDVLDPRYAVRGPFGESVYADKSDAERAAVQLAATFRGHPIAIVRRWRQRDVLWRTARAD